jgi:hypothetical protein
MFLPLVIWAAVFIFAYTQSPLFTSNQNQYFLHGFAAAGVGKLSQDWLANTFDPTPVFSALVQFVISFLHPWFFYLVAAFLIGLYFWLLVQIVNFMRSRPRSNVESAIFFSLLILIHSAAWRFALSRTVGPNWSYILEDGLADQRLLGPVLQPSMFGVFLLLSIWLFLKKRHYLAVVASGLAATIHPTYLLSAAALALAYMFSLFFEPVHSDQSRASLKRLGKILLVGLIAFIVVLPIVGYVYLTFSSSPAGTTAESRRILIDFRIPHHIKPEMWFDTTAILKLAIITAALWNTRRSRLFILLLVPTVIGLVFSLIYVGTRDDFLGLIFPWRLSTILVPVSSAVILEWLLQIFFRQSWTQSRKTQHLLLGITYILAGTTLLIGLTRQVLDFQRQSQSAELPLFTYVKTNLQEGQVVLTPLKLQEFRLATGSPVFVDFKSIPYRDLDVLEWYRRIQVADAFYKKPGCAGLSSLVDTEKITHVVIPAGMLDDGCDFLSLEFRSPAYTYYSLR